MGRLSCNNILDLHTSDKAVVDHVAESLTYGGFDDGDTPVNIEVIPGKGKTRFVFATQYTMPRDLLNHLANSDLMMEAQVKFEIETTSPGRQRPDTDSWF